MTVGFQILAQKADYKALGLYHRELLRKFCIVRRMKFHWDIKSRLCYLLNGVKIPWRYWKMGTFCTEQIINHYFIIVWNQSMCILIFTSLQWLHLLTIKHAVWCPEIWKGLKEIDCKVQMHYHKTWLYSFWFQVTKQKKKKKKIISPIISVLTLHARKTSYSCTVFSSFWVHLICFLVLVQICLNSLFIIICINPNTEIHIRHHLCNLRGSSYWFLLSSAFLIVVCTACSAWDPSNHQCSESSTA